MGTGRRPASIAGSRFRRASRQTRGPHSPAGPARGSDGAANGTLTRVASQIRQAANNPMRPNRVSGRNAAAARVDPDAGDTFTLWAGDVPFEVVADHPRL